MLARAPITSEPIGPTVPQAGVMATSRRRPVFSSGTALIVR